MSTLPSDGIRPVRTPFPRAASLVGARRSVNEFGPRPSVMVGPSLAKPGHDKERHLALEAGRHAPIPPRPHGPRARPRARRVHAGAAALSECRADRYDRQFRRALAPVCTGPDFGFICALASKARRSSLPLALGATPDALSSAWPDRPVRLGNLPRNDDLPWRRRFLEGDRHGRSGG